MIGRIYAEIVNGRCPTSDEYAMFIGVTNDRYRCMNCGADLQQHVNGKISYLPFLHKETILKEDFDYGQEG